MRQVRCDSGLLGWRDKLRHVYSDLEEFTAYSDIYSLAARLGFSDASAAWAANPTIQGSVNPNDFRVVAPSKARGA